MPKSEILFYFEIFFIGGILLASVFYFYNISFYYFFLLFEGLFAVFFFKNKSRLFFILILLSFLIGGIYFVLYSNYFFNQDYFFKNINHNFAAKLIIISEPYKKNYYQEFFVKYLNKKGKSFIVLKKDLPLEYGDIVYIKGKILPLKTTQYFKDNVFSQIKVYEIKKINSNKGNFLISFLYRIKNSLKKKINQTFNPNEASFYNGLLFGDRANMPKQFLEKLKKSGMVHLIALSGYNISIISVYFLLFLIFLGFNRDEAFYFAVLGIFLFVLMTGASKSCLRAAIMGSLYLLGQKIGSLPTPKYILALAAFLMVLINPKIAFFDIGFQLSFLATIGLFYLFEPIKQKTFLFLKNKFKKIYLSWENAPFLNEIFITISAQFSVAPLLLFYFGYLPITGIISNILVLPFIPLVMLVSFLIAILAFISQKLAFIFSLFLKPFWFYFKFLVDFGSRFIFRPGFFGMIIFFFTYFLILLFIIKSYSKNVSEI